MAYTAIFRGISSCFPHLERLLNGGVGEVGANGQGSIWRVTTYNKHRMPRFKLKGALERSASADLWKHTLSRIPTAYGRLTYLVSLRDPNSGIYRHHGLAAVFGRDESIRALRESHDRAFREWLMLDLELKTADLQEYIAGLDDDPDVVLKYLASTAHNEFQLPESARAADRLLFHRDFETAVSLIRNGLDAG